MKMMQSKFVTVSLMTLALLGARPA